jgi:hypothetical protein
MAGSRVEQAVKRFRESERLAEAGNTARSVEALHLAAELAVDELAARNDVVTRRPDMSPHEARARASVDLRRIGLVPGGFDNLLRRLNDDRKRTKYDGKPTRYDQLTLAQTQASVKLVLDNLGPGIWEPEAAPEPAVELPAGVEPPPPPPPAERPRNRRPLLLAAAAAALVAIIAVVALAAGGGDGKPTPKTPRARSVKAGATGRLGHAPFRVDHVYTGTKIAVGRGLKADGVFLVAYLQVGNSTDVLQPLRMSALRLQTRGGQTIPTAGRTARTTVPLQPGQATAVQVPFDVAPDRLPGARLLVDRATRGGRRLGPGLAMELPLDDGVGTIKPGQWRGSTSQHLRFTMRIDRGSVIRRVSLNIRSDQGKVCPISFKGVYFIDRTRFALRGDVVAAGRFSTSTEADGAVIAPPGGRCSTSQNVRWTATTPLK